MTQQITKIDAVKSVVLIQDFQQRVVNNFASEPEAVERNAGRRQAGRRTGDLCGAPRRSLR